MTAKVLIVGAVRTPIGSVGGGLSSLQAEDLGRHRFQVAV